MKVVVALDGSGLSEHALRRMTPFLQRNSAEVLLVAVVNPDAIHETVSTWEHREMATSAPSARLAMRGAPAEPQRALAEDRGQALEAARTEAENMLHRAAANSLPEFKDVSVHVAWEAHASGAIIRTAEQAEADLIVVGAHGRSGLKHSLLGSVSAELVRESPIPVVVVGPKM